MIEVTSSFSGIGALKRAKELYNLFSDSKLICFNFLLTSGDISNLDKDIDVKGPVEEFLNLIDKDKKVRIWTSRSDSDDYFMFLFTLDLLKDKDVEIKVIFVDDTTFISKNGIKSNPYSISCCAPEELSELLKNEKIMQKNEIEKFLNEWKLLKKENAPIRIVQNKVGRSLKEDYFDDLILKVLSDNGSVKIANVISVIMGKYEDLHGNLGDIIFAERIKKLIKLGKIIVVKQGEPHTLEKDGYISDGTSKTIIKISE